MGKAIGELIPYALGMATSPIAVIAVILMVLSRRGRANSFSFVGGWVVGVAAASVVMLALARVLENRPKGGSSDTSSIVDVALGALLLVLAAVSFRKRPEPGEKVTLPKWLRTIDTLVPGKAGLLGTFSPLGGGLNPTNLVLMAGAMINLSQHHLSPGDDALSILVFALIAVSTVAAPALLYLAGGKRSQPFLDKVKAWLTQNNAVVTGTLLFVIGAVLVGEGASGL